MPDPETPAPPPTSPPATPAAAAAAAAPAAGTDDDGAMYDKALSSAAPSTNYLIVAFGLLLLGWFGAWRWYLHVNPSDFKPAANYTAFAGLFVVALAVERLLEPVSGLIVPSADKTKQTRDIAVAKAARTNAPTDKKNAVAARTDAATSRANRAVMMWVVAAVIAMFASATLGLFLLRSLDTTTTSAAVAKTSTGATPPVSTDRRTGSKDPNRALDLLFSGLAVGAGTKPLHDLVTRIQSSDSSGSTT